MKTDADDRDEARMRQLFDASAEEASGAVLTKLSARAAEIPTKPRRVPSWFPRWAWAPGAAGLAAAAGALAVTFASWFSEPSEQVAPPAVALAPLAPVLKAPRGDDAVQPRKTSGAPPNTPNGDSDVSNAGSVAPELALESELDVLYGPPPDADLDAWLHATSELLHVHDG
jgi:hypothetical protein